MITKTRVLCATGAIAVVGGLGGGIAAQTPASPAFEVASIKPSPPSTDLRIVAIQRFQPGGRFTATNVQLRSLIMNAYSVTAARLLGGPAWIASQRFDVVAKAEADASSAQMQLMLQALLKERFNLAVHTDLRELPVYLLAVDGGDGRLGPNIRPAASAECADVGGSPNPRLITPDERRPSCGVRIGGTGNLEARGVTASQLASSLTLLVDRLVQDRTGLMGRFDLDLQWSRNPGAARQPGDAAQGITSPDDGVSIFTAVKEQLGLKLGASKEPVDVLVIDRAEHPAAD
jgi:uncharacterized protein (TIGR03435 family)